MANTDLPSNDGVLNDGKRDITASDKACCKLCRDRSGNHSSMKLFYNICLMVQSQTNFMVLLTLLDGK